MSEASTASRTRIAIAVPGIALILYGVGRLLVDVPASALFSLASWLIGSLIIHDALLSPSILGIGALLNRVVPARPRRYLQGALIAIGLVAVIALPMMLRQGSQPTVKAILLQNYGANLALLIGLIAATALLLYVVHALRSRTRSTDLQE